MRVVAYLRESTDPGDDRPAFAQQEDIRRHAAAHGLDVVAICQDVPRPGLALGREGYRSLLGIVSSGNVEAVLLPGVLTLSADVVLQEVMLWDLRSRGALVLSTDAADADVLSPTPADATRQFVRDVLVRVAEYREALGLLAPPTSPPAGPGGEGVVVHLVPATGSPGGDA
jgi:DNA invertase Pin-like site-specific DNA recombinase